MVRLHAAALRVFVVSVLLASVAHGLAAADENPTFGNWTIRCQDAGADSDSGCFIFQNLILREGGQRVLQVAVGYVPASETPVVLLSLPLGISLPPGISLRVDDTDAKRFAVERCEPNGCRAGFKLEAPLLEEFRDGKQITITFHDGRRRPIEVPMSLEGFRDGLGRLKRKD